MPFLLALYMPVGLTAQNLPVIIETRNIGLVYNVDKNQKLEQVYLGEKLSKLSEYKSVPMKGEAYIASGTTDLYEPAIQMVHSDGNPSLELQYSNHEITSINGNITSTKIYLKDPVYPVNVVLIYFAYREEDVITCKVEISHHEKKSVKLSRFASSMIHFRAKEYWLDHFHGDWAMEMLPEESRLTSGIKIIDSKLGTRANMYQTPAFFLSLDQPSDETKGELIAGTLAWSGNFRFLFEVEKHNYLRVISGMNPYASEYELQPDEIFTTPEFIFTYSNSGKGTASRNLHRWARNYGIVDGNGSRMTLLNNWEATGYKFDEKILSKLMAQGTGLGVDLFLLDDGWFGKQPRMDAKTGLGDWEANPEKLPHGLGYLVSEAKRQGLQFGIWLEPEMVNPESELYKKHRDWIISLPNRKEHYFRNQLVLDLANPDVQNFVFGVVDRTISQNPGIAFIKWDCNRMMMDTYSPYLKDKQSHIYIDYVRGLYAVLERVREKYPYLPIMLCSGGGGRTDYGALKYFTEFWPSDNTDPVERVLIQWGYSYFFPAIAMCSHVTSWGEQSVKFKIDVAMMGKPGFDIDPDKLTDQEKAFCRDALELYKEDLSDMIWHGDLYRLISPYKENRAVLMYVDQKKDNAVVFSYTMHNRYNEEFNNVHLQGLDPNKTYRVAEVNLWPGTKSKCPENGKSLSGDFLMKSGIKASSFTQLTSKVFRIKAE